MKTIRCTRNVGIRGASHAIGDVVEVEDGEARGLVAIGKAVYVDPAAAANAGALTTASAGALVPGRKAARAEGTGG